MRTVRQFARALSEELHHEVSADAVLHMVLRDWRRYGGFRFIPGRVPTPDTVALPEATERTVRAVFEAASAAMALAKLQREDDDDDA